MRTKADTPGRGPSGGSKLGLEEASAPGRGAGGAYGGDLPTITSKPRPSHWSKIAGPCCHQDWPPSPKAALGDPSGGSWVPGSLERALHAAGPSKTSSCFAVWAPAWVLTGLASIKAPNTSLKKICGFVHFHFTALEHLSKVPRKASGSGSLHGGVLGKRKWKEG